ncbi:MAG: hypothetical protein ACKVRN_01630 [Pyrinomonadaceae bacterium]
MTQRAEIVFEKEETVLLRQSSAVVNEFCMLCGTATVMLTPEALTLASAVSEREIFRLIEAGEIHFYEGPKVYVCLNSLAAIMEINL